MPLPSSISGTQINTEIGAAAASSVSLNSTAVRNVGVKATGGISFSDLRWGINFPGRRVSRSDAVVPGTDIQIYSSSPSIIMTASALTGGTNASNRAANNAIILYSNGTIQYVAITEIGGVGTFVTSHSRTWLTSGINSDYTANVVLTGGSLNGGNATVTNFPITSTLTWSRRVLAAIQDQSISASASGTLNIRSDGQTLISRPFSFSVSAYKNSNLK